LPGVRGRSPADWSFETATRSAKALPTLVATYQCCWKNNGKIQEVSYQKAPVADSELAKMKKPPTFGQVVHAEKVQGDWMHDGRGWLPIKIGEKVFFHLLRYYK